MRTTNRHLTSLPGCRPAGPPGPTNVAMPSTPAETAARMCDELAATAEHGHARAVELLAALERGDMLAIVRTAMELRPILRTLAVSHGELHVLMDEVANTTGGAS